LARACKLGGIMATHRNSMIALRIVSFAPEGDNA
jgi:hypothetical protein